MITFNILLSLATLTALAHSRGIEVYRNPGCNPNSAQHERHTLNLPEEPSGTRCTSRSIGLVNWPQDSDGNYIAYIAGTSDVERDCRAAILTREPRGSEFCGNVIYAIEGATPPPCRQILLPPQHGTAYCCGDCDPVIPPTREIPQDEAVSTRDVTEIKRGSPFASKLERRQGNCRFEPSGGTFASRGAQQVVSNTFDCPPRSGGCTFTESFDYTVGSTETFGAGVSAGASLFEIIQFEVSFSYSYSFEQSFGESQSHTVSIREGASGVVTWTPNTECVRGTFVGDCNGIATGQQGQACIPAAGPPRGTFGFIERL